jgi:hypothetical protein
MNRKLGKKISVISEFKIKREEYLPLILFDDKMKGM